MSILQVSKIFILSGLLTFASTSSFQQNTDFINVAEVDVDGSTYNLWSEVSSVYIKNFKPLNVFCRQADPKMSTFYFRSAALKIVPSSNDMTMDIVRGSSISNVHHEFNERKQWRKLVNNMNYMMTTYWNGSDIETSFSVFNSSCIGVSSSVPYRATLHVEPVNFRRAITFLLGLAIFLFAQTLSRSEKLFYIFGVSLGTMAFVLLFVVLFSRFLRKISFSYVTIGILWSFVAFCVKSSYYQLHDALDKNVEFVYYYLALSSIISFLICYRFGPPNHPKTMNILRWFIQFLGLALIYSSSEMIEVSTAIVAFLVFSTVMRQ